MNLKKYISIGPFVVIIFLILFRIIFPNKMTFLIEVSIYTIYVMGNNILMGYLGYTSFGQPFYMSCGAYAAAIYLAYINGNIFAAIIVAMLAGLLISLVLGPAFMRLKGSYFTLINASMCAIGVFIFERLLIDITHGNDGLWYRTNMNATPLIDIRFPENFFVFVMLVLLLAHYVYLKINKSSLGSVLLAVKSNPRKMKAIGYNIFKIRCMGYSISVVMSALSGALFAINFGFVNPDLGANTRAIEVLLATIIGGIGTVYGPFLGAIGFIGLKDVVSIWFSRWELIVGIITIFVLFKFNRGIWGGLEGLGSYSKKFVSMKKSSRKMEEV